jgi:predicted acetyltransferase
LGVGNPVVQVTGHSISIETRAIVDGEQEKFLAHMCEAFSLDLTTARAIFYSDPFFDLSHKRVLIDTNSGRIVSSLTIVPSAVRVLGGASIQVAGIAGVCTSPEYRRKGFARQLIGATLKAAPTEFGYAAAALLTDNPNLYRSVGFEHCSSVIHWTAHRKLLPPHQESEYAAECSFPHEPQLLSEIRDLYDHFQASQPGVFARSDRRWKAIEMCVPSYRVVTWRNGARLEGCIIFRMKNHRGDRVLDVYDIIASTAAARRGLIGYLQLQDDVDIISGEIRSSDLRKLGIQDTPRFTSYRKSGVMLAIMDLDACISAVAETGILTPVIRRSELGLTIRLVNSLATRDRKPLRLFSVSTNRLGVAIGLAPADEMSGDWISVDNGAMAQLFFGYRSATVLRSQNKLWVSSENALATADALFPSFETSVGPLDVF